MECNVCREMHSDLEHRCVTTEVRGERSGWGMLVLRWAPYPRGRIGAERAATAFAKRFTDPRKTRDELDVQVRFVDYENGARESGDWIDVRVVSRPALSELYAEANI